MKLSAKNWKKQSVLSKASLCFILINVYSRLVMNSYLQNWNWFFDSVQTFKTLIMSWTSTFNEATFRETLLPSSGNVNDCHTYLKEIRRPGPVTQPFTLPDDGRSISRNVSSLNILVNDMINLLYYEHWTDKQK